MKRRIAWDNVAISCLVIGCGAVFYWAVPKAVKSAQLEAKLASANRFGEGAMEIAKKSREEMRKLDKKCQELTWQLEGRLPKVIQ